MIRLLRYEISVLGMLKEVLGDGGVVVEVRGMGMGR